MLKYIVRNLCDKLQCCAYDVSFPTKYAISTFCGRDRLWNSFEQLKRDYTTLREGIELKMDNVGSDAFLRRSFNKWDNENFRRNSTRKIRDFHIQSFVYRARGYLRISLEIILQNEDFLEMIM